VSHVKVNPDGSIEATIGSVFDVHGENYCLEGAEWWLHCYAGLAGRKPWSWASLPGLRRTDLGPTWSGYEAVILGGRRIEGFGLLTSDGKSCWLTSERRT